MKLKIIFLIFILFNLRIIAQENQNTIQIPSIEITANIYQIPMVVTNGQSNWDVSELGQSIGFLGGFGVFGTAGYNNTVIAGHSENENGNPSIFYRLNELIVGDEILVNYNGNNFRYIVREAKTVRINS